MMPINFLNVMQDTDTKIEESWRTPSKEYFLKIFHCQAAENQITGKKKIKGIKRKKKLYIKRNRSKNTADCLYEISEARGQWKDFFHIRN